MNKIFKSAFVALVALIGLTMTSCVNKYDYDAATASGEQVYFDNSTSKVALSKDATSFTVPVLRVATTEATTIALTSTDESGLFTIPSSVSFAAGENKALVTIGYDPTKLEYDDFKSITLSLSDAANGTPYGFSSLTFLAGIPSPFVTIGKAKFMDSWMYDAETYFDVTLQQNEINPDIYRIVNPYNEILVKGGYSPNNVKKGPSEYLTFQLRHAGEEVGGAILTRDNLVTFEPFRTGYYISDYDSGDTDGEVWGFHISDDMFNATWHVEAAYLKNCVAAYKEDGTPGQINLAPWYYIIGLGGWNKSQEDKQIEIIFPGFTPADYSAELVYSGIFTDASEKVFAVGNLTLGTDAQDVKAIVMDASVDANAVADAIAAGELEATDVAAGSIQVPIPEDLTGKLQIIVVVLAGETVKNVVAAPFEYYGGGASPWNSLGQGYFVDDMILPLFGYDPEPYPVEIQESTSTPGLYRLVKMYSAVAADFGVQSGTGDVLVHAENPNGVYIPLQPLELTIGSNGPFSLSTDAGELVEEYGFDAVYAQLPNIFGKLADGVITFPVLEGENSAGNPVNYQTWVYLGEKAYFGGRNGAFQIVLPGVEAQSMKRAADFARRLNGANLKNAVKPSKISLKNKSNKINLVK
jgi:hypothetical protein